MGFLSDLKNNLTGSWADVSVTATPATRGQSTTITVHVNVKDNAIEINKVTAKVQCIEIVEVHNVRTTSAVGSSSQAKIGQPSPPATSGTAKATENLFDQEVPVAQAQQLAANSQQSFEATFQIPAHLPPSFTGRNARIEWKVMAAVDMKGNDPDSGWQVFEVC